MHPVHALARPHAVLLLLLSRSCVPLRTYSSLQLPQHQTRKAEDAAGWRATPAPEARSAADARPCAAHHIGQRAAHCFRCCSPGGLAGLHQSARSPLDIPPEEPASATPRSTRAGRTAAAVRVVAFKDKSPDRGPLLASIESSLEVRQALKSARRAPAAPGAREAGRIAGRRPHAASWRHSRAPRASAAWQKIYSMIARGLCAGATRVQARGGGKAHRPLQDLFRPGGQGEEASWRGEAGAAAPARGAPTRSPSLLLAPAGRWISPGSRLLGRQDVAGAAVDRGRRMAGRAAPARRQARVQGEAPQPLHWCWC